MSSDARREIYNINAKRQLGHRTPICMPAAELAGSCMSKVRRINTYIGAYKIVFLTSCQDKGKTTKSDKLIFEMWMYSIK